LRILITGDYEYSGDKLEVGKEYEATLTGDGTDAQRRTFYALVQLYWVSGQHSYNAKNYLHFCEQMKLYLGAGAEKYYSLVDDNGNPLKEPIIRYRVKSWKRYNKAERANAINNVISEMIQAKVDSKKFYEILDQLEKNSMNRIAG
jgi:hypothetical protein